MGEDWIVFKMSTRRSNEGYLKEGVGVHERTILIWILNKYGLM